MGKNRLFVAIDVPKDISTYLFTIQKRLSGKHTHSFHITLAFIGDADADQIIERLEPIQFSRFDLTLGKIGHFSHRVWWVGLEPQNHLFSLQKKVEEQLGKDINFIPHITLSRGKNTAVPQVEPRSFAVDRFRLYNSTIREGPHYTCLKEFLASQK